MTKRSHIFAGIALGLAGAGLLAALGAVAYTYSGHYNVAATAPHTDLVREWLNVGMRESVETHAAGIAAPPLDDPSLIHRGLREFEANCLPCHGAPGVGPTPIGVGLRPEAPELSSKAPEWTDGELFWIVKHGLKMTGMPAWDPVYREDELWALVAFVRHLGQLDPEGYAALARLELPPLADPARPGRLIALAGPPGQSALACGRCHGLDGEGHPSGAFPALAGQHADYLAQALDDYGSGRRRSGAMAPVAHALSPDQRRAVAQYYAGLPPAPAPRPRDPDPLLLQQGGALAAAGTAEIQACRACHGVTANGRPKAPILAGQHPEYIALQLRLWRAGERGGGPDAAIMEPIARRMSDAQIRAVAIYYARLTPR